MRPTLLACLLLLTACTVGPDFVPPAPTAVDGFAQDGDRAAPPAAAPLSDQWWRQLGSPALDQVMALALADNPGLAAAEARIRQAEGLTAAAAGALAPQIGVGAAAGRQKYGVALFGPSHFHIPPFNYFEVGPTASVDLDLFGGGAREVERQRALTDYQQRQWAAARLSLVGETALQAIAIAGTREQIGLLDGIASLDAQILRLIEAGRAAGAMTENDRLTAQSRLTADRALLPAPQQRLAAARHALAALVGRAPAQWAPPDFALAGFAAPDRLPALLPSELARHRPDIAAAEAEIHAANAAIGVAEANLYPKIGLTASATLQSLEPQNLFEFGNAAASLLGSVTHTIYDGGRLQAQKQSAQAALTAQQALYRQTVLTAFAEVADSLQALANDEEALALAARALDLAEHALALARQERDAGNSGMLPLLAAERATDQSRLDLAAAREQQLRDFIILCHHLGGGVIPPPESPATD